MYDCIIFRNCTLFLNIYVLALEKKNGRGENSIYLKYIRSVQSLLHEGDKVTLINCVVKQLGLSIGVNGV